jgi:hypothetical protein
MCAANRAPRLGARIEVDTTDQPDGKPQSADPRADGRVKQVAFSITPIGSDNRRLDSLGCRGSALRGTHSPPSTEHHQCPISTSTPS